MDLSAIVYYDHHAWFKDDMFRNMVERMGALKAGQEVGPDDLPAPRKRRGAAAAAGGPCVAATARPCADRGIGRVLPQHRGS